MKTYLTVVPVLRRTIDMAAHAKVFYVYETNARGLLLRQHGLNLEGEPFVSEDQARAWVKTQMQNGRHVFRA